MRRTTVVITDDLDGTPGAGTYTFAIGGRAFEVDLTRDLGERPYAPAMPTTATDLRYGRRGGRWLPAGYTPALDADTPHCDVCDQPLAAGQTVRHATCAVEADQLFPDA